MLRATIALFLVLFCVNDGISGNEEKFAKSFDKFVKSTMADVFKSYEGNHYTLGTSTSGNYFGKTSHQIDPIYKYDLEKTNSIISPIVGSLEVNINTIIYEGYIGDMNRAEKENKINRTKTHKYIIKFVPDKKNKWVVLNARVFYDEWEDIGVIDPILELRCDDKIRK